MIDDCPNAGGCRDRIIDRTPAGARDLGLSSGRTTGTLSLIGPDIAGR
jgi:hypothetical protein